MYTVYTGIYCNIHGWLCFITVEGAIFTHWRTSGESNRSPVLLHYIAIERMWYDTTSFSTDHSQTHTHSVIGPQR